MKIKYGKGEIIKEGGNIRIIKFNSRYYTVVGRMFALKGNHWDLVGKPEFEEIYKNEKHYAFNDWDNLTDMYNE